MVQYIDISNKRQQTLGGAINAGTQGFIQGKQLGGDSLAKTKAQMEIAEMQRKQGAYQQQVPGGYFRDPVTGKLMPQDPYRGKGVNVNFQGFQPTSGNQLPSQQDPEIPAGATQIDDDGDFTDAQGNKLGRAF